MIVNEESEIIGLTTHINYEKKQSHIGSWLGYPYWEKDIMRLLKRNFKIAF